MLRTSLGREPGTSVTYCKKTIVKCDVIDLLRCKPYTDKKHIYLGR